MTAQELLDVVWLAYPDNGWCHKDEDTIESICFDEVMSELLRDDYPEPETWAAAMEAYYDGSKRCGR